MADTEPLPRLSARSPQLRLTVGAALVIAVVLTIASLATLAALRHSLIASIDTAARDDARDILAATARIGDLGPMEAPTPDAAVQMLDPAGRVIGASDNAPATPLIPGRGTRPATITATGPLPVPQPADAYRVAALLTPDGSTILVALPADDVTDATNELASVLLLGAPILFVLLVGLAWLVTGRALAPMTALHRRQEQFTSDAAHELRTPLAALQARLELLEGGATADGELRAELPRLRAEVARMSALVDGLLTLVRSGDGKPHGTDVDLDDVVRDAVRRLRERTAHTVAVPAMDAVRVHGDATALSRLVDNLLDNADRHAQSAITVTVTTDRGDGVVTVADDGPGIAPADREQVFGRFTRLDSARTRDAGGVGLGLAIVRAVARAHSGDVSITSDGPGAHFEVRLPATRT